MSSLWPWDRYRMLDSQPLELRLFSECYLMCVMLLALLGGVNDWFRSHFGRSAQKKIIFSRGWLGGRGRSRLLGGRGSPPPPPPPPPRKNPATPILISFRGLSISALSSQDANQDSKAHSKRRAAAVPSSNESGLAVA